MLFQKRGNKKDIILKSQALKKGWYHRTTDTVIQFISGCNSLTRVLGSFMEFIVGSPE